MKIHQKSKIFECAQKSKAFPTFQKELINKEIGIFFKNLREDDSLKLIYDSIKDFVLNGGKRLRPSILIMAYKACNGKSKEISKAALSVEFLHNSTLIHDDIMDEDEMRRGKPSVHNVLGINNAICAGNILHTLGMSVLSASNFPPELVNKSLKIYSDASKIVNNGQILDNSFENKEIDEKQYLQMIGMKTAALFKASAQIGATLANASEEEISQLSDDAFNLGIAFQLQDDLLDISEKKGHAIGSDIKKGKRTLLLIKSLENAGKEQKATLKENIGKQNADIEKVKQIFENTGSIGYCKNLIKKYIEKAKENIKDKKLFGELLNNIFN